LAKKKVEKRRHEVTKRQLSQWQRQKRRQRIILGFGIFIIVAVLGIVGGGWYINQYQPLHQTVIIVNDNEFDMNYYIKVLKIYGRGQSTDFLYYLADVLVKVIEENELVRQGAMELGISFSDAEVDEELMNRELPVSREYRDIVRAELLASKVRDEHFEQQMPISAEQRHVMAMLLESESQANEVIAQLEASEDFDKDFADLAGELSLEGISQNENGDLGWHPKDILTIRLGTSMPDEYAFSGEVGVLSEPLPDETITKGVGYWFIKVLEREEESGEAHVQAILLGSEEEALDVRARLEASEDFDKDFAELAGELSQHDASKESGGDLGWLAPGTMSSAFDEFAFDAEIELGMMSGPIRDDSVITKGGYWLLKVVDEDEARQIEDDDRGLLKNKALDEWVTGLWDNAEIDDSYLDNEKKWWAIERAIGG
jgi:parvulin-like peptidyl-prolyl isomerase